ncbi:hypothetical protein BH09GEM1_BH09GEM1_42270 [soil metagenome]
MVAAQPVARHYTAYPDASENACGSQTSLHHPHEVTRAEPVQIVPGDVIQVIFAIEDLPVVGRYDDQIIRHALLLWSHLKLEVVLAPRTMLAACWREVCGTMPDLRRRLPTTRLSRTPRQAEDDIRMGVVRAKCFLAYVIVVQILLCSPTNPCTGFAQFP